MRKSIFCLISMLALLQCGHVVVLAQDPASARTFQGFGGREQPVTHISGICGLTLGGHLPLDEYRKRLRWRVGFSVVVYASDGDHKKVIGTQTIEPTGYFRLNLPPGKYTLVPGSDWAAEPRPPVADPQTVTVQDDQFAVVTVNYGE